jgi:protein-disulfide isomerase
VSRPFFFLIAVLATFAFAQPGWAGDPAGEIAIGNPKAPVTIVEYYSMTCSHCAHFETTVFPDLKKQYIDTGKARFVFKDFPLDAVALRGAKLARCVFGERGPEAYVKLVEMLMKTQDNWASSTQLLDSSVMLAGGLSKQKVDACVDNKKLEEFVLGEQLAAQKAHGIRSTPSFVINGKMYAGAMSLEQFEKVLKGP